MTNKKRIKHLEDLFLMLVRSCVDEGIVAIPPSEDDIIEAINNIKGTECEECGGLFKKYKMKEVTFDAYLKDVDTPDFSLSFKRKYYYCKNCAPPYDIVTDNGKYYKTTEAKVVEVNEKGKKI